MLGKLHIYVILHLLTFNPTKSHVIPIFICFHPFSTWVSWDFYQPILPSDISSVSMDCSCDIGTVAESKATPGRSWAWGKPSRCSFWEYIVCKIHVYNICICIHVYLNVYVYIYVNINEYIYIYLYVNIDIYMCVTRSTAFRRPWVFCDQRCIMGDFWCAGANRILFDLIFKAVNLVILVHIFKNMHFA